MSSPKGPTTTRVPDWDRLFEELLERQNGLLRVVADLQASGGEPIELMDNLLKLGMHLRYVDQMRQVTLREDLSHAA